MRKTIIALIAALALVVAAPAMAAEINLGGSLETALTLARGRTSPGKTGVLKLTTAVHEVDVNAGEKIRVGLEFGTTEVGLDEDGELTEGHARSYSSATG